jgi:hypothetical protein
VVIRKLKGSAILAFLFMWLISAASFAGAQGASPRPTKPRSISVAEPATIVLVAGGLGALALVIKKKRNHK